MTKKTKILIGILVVVIVIVGVWWFWNNYIQYDEIACENLNKDIADKMGKLNKNCQTKDDCKIEELLGAMKTGGAYPICLNKNENTEEICSLQKLQHEKCKEFLPDIHINPSPFNGCECINNKCVAINKKREITINTDKTEYEQGETVKITVKNNLDVPIWYAKHVWCGTSFWFLESCKNEEITHYTICSWVVAQHDFTKLNSSKTLSGEWGGKILDQEEYELKVAEPGCYKIAFPYSKKEKSLFGEGWDGDMVKTYSNEFVIKE